MKIPPGILIMVYWAALFLSATIIALNFGLVLLVFGIFILGLFALHFFVGTKIREDNIRNPFLLIAASVNLLLFSLVRIEGVHIISNIGLTRFLDLFGIHIGFDAEYATVFILLSSLLFLTQLWLDFKLYKMLKN